VCNLFACMKYIYIHQVFDKVILFLFLMRTSEKNFFCMKKIVEDFGMMDMQASNN